MSKLVQFPLLLIAVSLLAQAKPNSKLDEAAAPDSSSGSATKVRAPREDEPVTVLEPLVTRVSREGPQATGFVLKPKLGLRDINLDILAPNLNFAKAYRLALVSTARGVRNQCVQRVIASEGAGVAK